MRPPRGGHPLCVHVPFRVPSIRARRAVSRRHHVATEYVQSTNIINRRYTRTHLSIAKAGGVVERRRPVSLVNVSTFFAQIGNHVGCPERTRPVQQRLSDIVGVINLYI